MGDIGSLVNLGELAKPVITLIKKISNAVGVVYEPTHIRRVAEAKADAALTTAEGQAKVEEVTRRAIERWVHEETRKQVNMEEITSKAIPLIEDSAPTESIDEDWIAGFFDRCRLISDEEMQELWARVLAGEANSPGKFSKRTLDFLSNADKKDALMFQSLCRLLWNKGMVGPLIFDVEHTALNQMGINFTLLTHFDKIGLLRFETPPGFAHQKDLPGFLLEYHGRTVKVEGRKDGVRWRLGIGHVMLSEVGVQLASILKVEPNWGYFDYCKDKLSNDSGPIIELP